MPMTTSTDAVVGCLTCGGPAEFAFMTLQQAVYRCQDQACGLAFDHPQPSDATLAALYALDYSTSEAFGCTPVADAQAIVDAIVARMGSLRGRRVLDFGAGVGTVSGGLQRAGAQVVAIETAPEGRARITTDLGIASFPDVAALRAAGAADPFDLIVMVEVVEHLRDPKAALAEVRALLADDGWILITTPNLGSLQFRLKGARWYNVASAVHIVYFDARSLAATLRAAGFHDIRPIREAAQHPGQGLVRRSIQRVLRPLGLGGGLQVTARRRDGR